MKKGFTLIELLAVIVILAIIAVITVPMIMNVIDESKMNSFRDSVYGLFSSAELYIVNNKDENKISQGIEISELKIKNKNQFISGIFYFIDNKIKLEYVSNGKYCANGFIDDLSVVKGGCIYDKIPPTITYNINSSDWKEKVTIDLTALDENEITEFKYKIVPKYEQEVDFEWNIIDGNSYQIDLLTPGIYNIYLSAKDVNNNIKNASIGEFKIFSYDDYKIWLEYLNQNSSNYDSLDTLLDDQNMFNQLVSTNDGLEYLKKSKENILPKVLNNKILMEYLIKNTDFLPVFASDSDFITELKSNSNYESYVDYILLSTRLTNTQKYQYALPCYIYNYGIYNLISTFSNYVGPSNGSQNHSFTNSETNGLYFYGVGNSSASQQNGNYYTDKVLSGTNLQKYNKIGTKYNFNKNLSYESMSFGLFSGSPSSSKWEGNLSESVQSISFNVGSYTDYISIPTLNSSKNYGLYLRMCTNKYQVSGNYYVSSYIYSIWLQ